MAEKGAADISNEALHISARMHTGYDTQFNKSTVFITQVIQVMLSDAHRNCTYHLHTHTAGANNAQEIAQKL